MELTVDRMSSWCSVASMDTTTQTQTQLHGYQRPTDPEPFINCTTLERSATGGPEWGWMERPRLSWPQKGGRMVRRDYLRPGDWAVSSHYGLRKVEAVHTGGISEDEIGVTTRIVWETPDGVREAFSEIYDSKTPIELLTEEQAEIAQGHKVIIREGDYGLFYLLDLEGNRFGSGGTPMGGLDSYEDAERTRIALFGR